MSNYKIPPFRKFGPKAAYSVGEEVLILGKEPGTVLSGEILEAVTHEENGSKGRFYKISIKNSNETPIIFEAGIVGRRGGIRENAYGKKQVWDGEGWRALAQA